MESYESDLPNQYNDRQSSKSSLTQKMNLHQQQETRQFMHDDVTSEYSSLPHYCYWPLSFKLQLKINIFKRNTYILPSK